MRSKKKLQGILQIINPDFDTTVHVAPFYRRPVKSVCHFWWTKSLYPRPTSSDIITIKPSMEVQEASFPLPLKKKKTQHSLSCEQTISNQPSQWVSLKQAYWQMWLFPVLFLKVFSHCGHSFEELQPQKNDATTSRCNKSLLELLSHTQFLVHLSRSLIWFLLWCRSLSRWDYSNHTQLWKKTTQYESIWAKCSWSGSKWTLVQFGCSNKVIQQLTHLKEVNKTCVLSHRIFFVDSSC